MRSVVFVLCMIMPFFGWTQFSVSFHQTNLPFVGFGYYITNKARVELRLGTDNYIDIISVEAVVLTDLIVREDYEFYAGLGAKTSDFAGIVVPVGLNIYPLPVKQFGFHMELAPIIESGVLLRGSWGIRYRFGKRYDRQKK